MNQFFEDSANRNQMQPFQGLFRVLAITGVRFREYLEQSEVLAAANGFHADFGVLRQVADGKAFLVSAMKSGAPIDGAPLFLLHFRPQ